MNAFSFFPQVPLEHKTLFSKKSLNKLLMVRVLENTCLSNENA